MNVRLPPAVREHASDGDLDGGDVAVSAELGHEAAAGLQRAMHAREHRIVIAHPVQRRVRKHRVELALERQSLRIDHPRVEAARRAPRPPSPRTHRRPRPSRPPRQSSPSASPRHTRHRGSARPAADSATRRRPRRARGRRQRWPDRSRSSSGSCCAQLYPLDRSELRYATRAPRKVLHARLAPAHPSPARPWARLSSPTARPFACGRLTRERCHVVGDFNDRQRNDASLLTRDEQGHWRGFIPGARDRERYMFYVVGDGSEGPKRDPYARELQAPFPSECIIRSCGLPMARERVRHAGVSRFRHLPAACRHVLHAEPAGQRRHVSGRRAQDSVSGRASA